MTQGFSSPDLVPTHWRVDARVGAGLLQDNHVSRRMPKQFRDLVFLHCMSYIMTKPFPRKASVMYASKKRAQVVASEAKWCGLDAMITPMALVEVLS